jgi:peptidoglycan hydrolase FlgJ
MDARVEGNAGLSLLAGTSRPPASGAARDPDHLRNTAREFEEVFLAQMLQPMLSGLTPEEPFGGGPGEEIWQSMLVKEYGKAIVAGGGIGIADAVMREILLAQENMDQGNMGRKQVPQETGKVLSP